MTKAQRDTQRKRRARIQGENQTLLSFTNTVILQCHCNFWAALWGQRLDGPRKRSNYRTRPEAYDHSRTPFPVRSDAAAIHKPGRGESPRGSAPKFRLGLNRNTDYRYPDLPQERALVSPIPWILACDKRTRFDREKEIGRSRLTIMGN
jgi:hypothetical protein